MNLLERSSVTKICLVLSVPVALLVVFYLSEPSLGKSQSSFHQPVRDLPLQEFAGRDLPDPTIFENGLEQLPHSLQGTEPPAGLIIDSTGNLVVRRSLRDFFDYFLSAMGEESIEILRGRIKAYMVKSLPSRAYLQAEKILDGYMGYRLALQALHKAGGMPVKQLDLLAVSSQKQQERALRIEYLAADVCAVFFADDDQYDDFTLARLKLESDQSLSEEEKKAKFKELLAQLPNETKSYMKSLNKLQDLAQINAGCQQQGCTREQLFQQRATLLGEDAAGRLQALDDIRAAWAARVNAYLSKRELILDNNELSDQDKHARILQLQRIGFNQEEQLRLPAFEYVRDHSSVH